MRKNKLKYFIQNIILIIVGIWAIFPIFWMFSMSLKRRVDALAMPPRWIFSPIIDNYIKVFNSQDFTRFYFNSILIGLFTILFVLIIGIPASYTLSKMNFRGKKDIDFWILSTRMAPPVGILIPYFLIFKNLGILDTRASIVIMHIALNLSFAIWVMKGFFAEIPKGIEEAALVDGCSHWRAFIRIILPLVAPGLVATAIIVFLFSWNELLFAVTLAGNASKTVPVALYNFVSYEEIDWGPLSASAMLALIPVLVFISFVQKQLIKGLTLGAINK